MAVEGWKEDQLGNLVDIRKGKKVESHDSFSEGYVPYIGAENFSGKITKYAPPNNAVLCTDQDVLMLWDGERSGLVSTNWEGAVSSTVARLSSKGKIDPKFLYHFLSHKYEWIQSNRTGQAVPHVPKNLAEMLLISVPPKLEQKKITEILESVDGAIAKTESVIAQTQRVKQGLLQKAFGMGQSCDYSLKDDILLLSGQHIDASLVTSSTDDTPYLTGPADFPSGKIIVSKYTASPKTMCKKGDVLITVKGSGTGKTIIADDDYCISRQLMGIRVNKWNKDYVFYALSFFIEKIRENAVGFIPGVTRDDILGVKVPRNSSKEQSEIAASLIAIDLSIEVAVNNLFSLNILKKGLMSDLFTGRVRVNVDAIASGKVGAVA